MSRLSPLFAAVFLVACPGTEPQSDIYEGPSFGRIAGVVTDTDGQALADVTVEAQEIVGLTDAEGHYVLDGLNPAESILVEFDKSDYARSYRVTTIQSWEQAHVDAVLADVDWTGSFDAAAGALLDAGDVTMDFPAGIVVDADGQLFSGNVNIEMTHVDPYTNELDGAPGDLSALAFDTSGTSKDAIVPNQLVSYGMIDVSLTSDDGEELNIDEESEGAEISMPISNGDLANVYQVAGGDAVQTWSFSKSSHRWVEEGEGQVETDEEGEMSFRFSATHFSWWNADQGSIPTCASGRIVDYLGYPIRGAAVQADGGGSRTVSYTDEDGYYVISVLAGTTVNFSGSTYVARRTWSAGTSAYTDCPDGDHFCEVDENGMDGACFPIPDMQIDVCRVTGAISVENVDAVLEDQKVIDSDHISATFWEPRGDIEYCSNPWDALSMNTCEVLSSGTDGDFFPSSAESGLPDEGRSVGSWLQISNGRQPYVLERQRSADDTPYYNWEAHSTDGESATTETPDIRAGDQLDVQSSGDATDYMGPWQESRLAEVPGQLTWRNPEILEQSGGSSLSLSYAGASSDSRGALVFGNVADSGTGMMCRFSDTGTATIPASTLSQLDGGWGGLGIYHLEDSYSLGPDGMPIRLQIFSGTSAPLNIP